MTLDIKAMVIVFIYAIASNMFLLNLANSDDSIGCNNILSNSYNYSYSSGNLTEDTDSKDSGVSLMSLALNRCAGLPSWIYWLTQIPTVLGIFYIIRAFVGFT